jgi:hypothetical protein
VAEHAEKAALVLRIHLPRAEVVGVFWSDHTKTSMKLRPNQTAVIPSEAKRNRGISFFEHCEIKI